MYNYKLKITNFKKLRNYNNNNFRKLHDEYFLKIPLCRPWRECLCREVPKQLGFLN